MNYLGIDIGGSWIKGTCIPVDSFGRLKTGGFTDLVVRRVASPLHASSRVRELIHSLEELVAQSGSGPGEIAGIGISTAGIVDYAGKRVIKAAEHLSILLDENWIETLKKQHNCPVVLINDADAAAIGIAELDKLEGYKTSGIMPVGTGLGFSVWRNGRRWRPGLIMNLLGSIQTPSGTYDEIASVSRLASADSGNDLSKIFTDPHYFDVLKNYLDSIKNLINTAGILYNLDEVIICGGLADAVTSFGYPLEKELNLLLTDIPKVLDHQVKVRVMKEGNLLPLIGALALAKGEAEAQAGRVVKTYMVLESEKPYDTSLQLQDLGTEDILEILYKAEQESGTDLRNSLPAMFSVIEVMSEKISKGGRIIYVGAGSSGRLAAMDAVEINCTYGFPKDRILALIAGGIADAAIEIESDFEEDASAIPEMLLLNIKPDDSVIGISASGTAYFVQSALSFAKNRGAYTVMIQRDHSDASLIFCDQVIPLQSGNEVVAGSTRMKAGTSTKKILNFISSTLMIKAGKVAGSYMVDVACINNKLVERAKSILRILYNMDEKEAEKRLKDADLNLGSVIRSLS